MWSDIIDVLLFHLLFCLSRRFEASVFWICMCEQSLSLIGCPFLWHHICRFFHPPSRPAPPWSLVSQTRTVTTPDLTSLNQAAGLKKGEKKPHGAKGRCILIGLSRHVLFCLILYCNRTSDCIIYSTSFYKKEKRRQIIVVMHLFKLLWLLTLVMDGDSL